MVGWVGPALAGQVVGLGWRWAGICAGGGVAGVVGVGGAR